MYQLSICIPTYNGREKLDCTLPALLKKTEGLDVQICISDNCSTDGTGEFIRKLAERNANIKYHKQISNLGFAKNYEDVLKMGDGTFCWLMGDDDLPVDLDSLYSELTEGLLCNKASAYLVNGTKSGFFSLVQNNSEIGLKNLVAEYGWIPTWISRYIVSRDIAQTNTISSFKGAFPHVAWLLQMLSVHGADLHIKNEVHVTESDAVSCSYSSRTYEYFVSDYYNLIVPYRKFLSDKEIRSYLRCAEKKFVKFGTLCRLRAERQFSINSIKKVSEEFQHFSFFFKFTSYLVAYIPRFFFFAPWKLYKKFKNVSGKAKSCQ